MSLSLIAFPCRTKQLSCARTLNLAYDLTGQRWLDRLGAESPDRLRRIPGELFHISSIRQERRLDYPFTRQFSMTLFATF